MSIGAPKNIHLHFVVSISVVTAKLGQIVVFLALFVECGKNVKRRKQVATHTANKYGDIILFANDLAAPSTTSVLTCNIIPVQITISISFRTTKQNCLFSFF